jgi:hypothetical protein
LSKDGLIEEKRTKIHKQKRIKYLSTTGNEVSHIIKSINQYKEHLATLSKRQEELVDLFNRFSYNESVIKNILRERRWKDRQIIKYKRVIEGASNLIFLCWNNFLNCLRLRLVTLINDSNPANSLIEIISYLISDAISFSIKVPSSELAYGGFEGSKIESLYTNESQKLDMLNNIESIWIDFPEPFFPTAKKLVVAYLQLLKISPNMLTPSLDQLKAERHVASHGDTESKATLTSHDFDYLLAAYAEYFQEST